MEIVVTGSSIPSKDAFLSVTDIESGTHHHTFKQSSSSTSAVAQLPSTLFVCQNDKAVINVYRWHKEAIDQKLIVPEKLDVLTASHDGVWLLGGSGSGKLYLWEIASGNLLFVKDAHYQGITSCCFAEDDLTFVTGSADATIQVWRTTDVLDPYTSQELVKPIHTLSSHTLRVTQLHIGSGNSVTSRLYSASLDQTIRIWDLCSGENLVTLLLPSPVTCMAVDSAERHIFAGTETGVIHEVRMYKQDKVVQVIGDMGAIISVGQSVQDGFHGHESSVTALAMSLDGAMLCSGAQDGNTFIWDVSTKQMLRKVKQQPGPVTLLHITTRPSVEMATVKNQNAQFQPLKRVQLERDRDEHHVYLRLSSSRKTQFQPMSDIEACNFGLDRLTAPVSTDPVAQETIVRLQEELRKIHGSYADLRLRHEQLNKEYISSQL